MNKEKQGSKGWMGRKALHRLKDRGSGEMVKIPTKEPEKARTEG